MPYELLDQKPAETGLGKIARGGARTLARAGEAIAGLPGDIAATGLALGNLGLGKLTGQENILPASTFLPTSEQLREEITKPLTGEYLEPQTQGEKFWDDIIGDASTILVPFKGKVPFAKAAKRAFGIASAANAAKWGAETLTDSPLIGAGAKIGTVLLAGSAGGRRELGKMQKDLYKEGYSHVGPNAKINIVPEKTKINQFISKLNKGDSPNKKFLLERFSALDSLSPESSNYANVNELINLKQDWNKHLRTFDLDKNSRRILKDGVNVLNQGIAKYGSKNPKFYQPYLKAEELTTGLNASNLIYNVLDKHPTLMKSIKNPLIKTLFGGGATYGFAKLSTPNLVGIASGAFAAKEAAKAYQLLITSPLARQYYKDLLVNIGKNDLKAAAKDIAKLNKEADSFLQKNPDRYEFI